MRDRRKQMKRILDVQKKLHTVAEMNLARLQREGTELQRAQAALIDALNDDDTLHGLFIDSMSRRLTKLSGEAERVSQEEAEQAKRVLREARRVKTTERLSGKLDQEGRRAAEKLDFQTLLDAFVTRDASST